MLYIYEDDRLVYKGVTYIPMGSGNMVDGKEWITAFPEGGGSVVALKINEVEIMTVADKKGNPVHGYDNPVKNALKRFMGW